MTVRLLLLALSVASLALALALTLALVLTSLLVLSLALPAVLLPSLLLASAPALALLASTVLATTLLTPSLLTPTGPVAHLPSRRPLAPLARRSTAALSGVVVLWPARSDALPALPTLPALLALLTLLLLSSLPTLLLLSSLLALPALSTVLSLVSLATLLTLAALSSLSPTVVCLPAGLALVLAPAGWLFDAAAGAAAWPPLLAVGVVTTRRLRVAAPRTVEGLLAALALGVRALLALAPVDRAGVGADAAVALDLPAVVVFPSLAAVALVLGLSRALGDIRPAAVVAALLVTPPVGPLVALLVDLWLALVAPVAAVSGLSLPPVPTAVGS